MSLKLVNKNYTYSAELRIKAIEVYQAGITHSIIVKELEIKDKKRVNMWVKQLNEQGIDAFVARRGIQSIRKI